MTPVEHAYLDHCAAVAQLGFVLWLDRVNAFWDMTLAPAAPTPRQVARPKLTVVR